MTNRCVKAPFSENPIAFFYTFYALPHIDRNAEKKLKNILDTAENIYYNVENGHQTL